MIAPSREWRHPVAARVIAEQLTNANTSAQPHDVVDLDTDSDMADTLPDGQGGLSSGEDDEVDDRAPGDDIDTCPPDAVRPGGSAEEGRHDGDGMDSGQRNGSQPPATGADPEERGRTRGVPRRRRRGRREGRSRDSAAEPVEGHDPGQPGPYRTSRQHELLAAGLQDQRKRIKQTTAASRH
eukprot:801421-Rhodomonas_salina.1